MFRNKKNKDPRNRPLVKIGLLILYKVSLDILYIYGVAPFYSYTGLTYEFQSEKYTFSFLAFLIISPLIIKLYKSEKPSSLVMLLFNLVYFIPGCTVYSFTEISTSYFHFFVIYWYLLMILYFWMPFFNINLPKYSTAKRTFNLMVILAVILSVFITGYYNGFRLNFDLMNVYELRFDVQEMSLPLAISYLKPLVSSLIPIAVVYFLMNKKYTIVIILTFLQLFLFSFGGHKTTIFFLLLAILAYYFYTYKANRYIVLFLIGLNIIPFIEMHFSEEFSLVAGMIQRRNMYAVNLISYQYYDFFSTHEHDYLRQSILGRLGMESPYPSITRMMSQTYAGTDGGLNNGLCGDAYMNFGWLSLMIYPMLINVALRFFDACSKGLNYKILVMVSIIFSINFINSFFFTVMLTHGFIMICIFLYFIPRKGHGQITS